MFAKNSKNMLKLLKLFTEDCRSFFLDTVYSKLAGINSVKLRMFQIKLCPNRCFTIYCWWTGVSVGDYCIFRKKHLLQFI